MFKKLKRVLTRKRVGSYRGPRIKEELRVDEELADKITEIMSKTNMTDLKKSSLVSSKLRKEPPLSIDATKPKLSLKQVFIKKGRDYERLPKTCTPKSYHLYLLPHLDLFTFDGKVIIEALLEKPTKKIILNSAGLNIKHISSYSSLEEAQSSNDTDMKKKSTKFLAGLDTEILEVMMESQKPAGTCALKILFSGVIADQMKGFHYSRYEVKNTQLSYNYLTKCEPCDARRVFPCFDEPHFKATFSLTLSVPRSKVVLSNMTEKKVSQGPLKGHKTIQFEETPPMSSYMFCFVIGDFDYVAASTTQGISLRVYTPPDMKREGKFALKLAVKALEFLESTVDIPLPLKKLDFVPIREMNTDVQSNWGISIFQGDAILTHEYESAEWKTLGTASVDYQNIALLVARAVAQQWTGNMVSMHWWSHTWLNIGIAGFLKFITVHAVFQQYNVWPQFATLVTERALKYDTMPRIHPLVSNIVDPPDIEEYTDVISTCKGAAIMRMISGLIGEDKFRLGLHDYLVQRHKTSVVTEDLWTALEFTSQMPVVKIMEEYTNTSGYPLIHVLSVTFEAGATVISGKQERFRATIEDQAYGKWLIPINVIASADPHNVIHSEVVEGTTFELHFKAAEHSKWFLLNPVRTGYYRVMYPADMVDQFLHSIRTQRIGFLDRVVLLQDEFALALSGYKSFVDVLILLQAYTDEVNYHVWSAIDEVVTEMDRYLSYASKQAHSRFQDYILEIYARAEERFGFKSFTKSYPPAHEFLHCLRLYCECLRQQSGDSTEDHMVLLLHGLVIRRLCILGHPATVHWAKDLYIAHANRESVIHPDIYRAVLLGFIRWKASEENLHLIIRGYMRAQTMQEKEHVMEGFGLFQDHNEIRKILQFAISKQVYISHTPKIMARVGLTKVGRHMAWSFFKEHYAHFSREYYQNEQLLTPIFENIIFCFVTESKLEDVRSFFDSHRFQGLDRQVTMAIDHIQRNIAWVKRDLARTQYYLDTLVAKLL